MKPTYQAMLDRIAPHWRELSSLEIIGLLLDYIARLEAAGE